MWDLLSVRMWAWASLLKVPKVISTILGSGPELQGCHWHCVVPHLDLDHSSWYEGRTAKQVFNIYWHCSYFLQWLCVESISDQKFSLHFPKFISITHSLFTVLFTPTRRPQHPQDFSCTCPVPSLLCIIFRETHDSGHFCCTFYLFWVF